MTTTYINQTNAKRIREPLFNVFRIKYRNFRSSEKENLETNLFKLDISRIMDELETIDLSIIEYMTNIVGEIKDITESVKLDDGLSYAISGVNVHLDLFKYVSEQEISGQVLNIDVTNKLSAKLTRLYNKVSRIESEY